MVEVSLSATQTHFDRSNKSLLWLQVYLRRRRFILGSVLVILYTTSVCIGRWPSDSPCDCGRPVDLNYTEKLTSTNLQSSSYRFKFSVIFKMTIYDGILFSLKPGVEIEVATIPAGRVWIAFQRHVLSVPGCEKLYWDRITKTDDVRLVLGEIPIRRFKSWNYNLIIL